MWTLGPNGVMTVQPGDEDILGKNDKGVDDQFMPSSMVAPRISGWQGSVHERTVDNTKDTLTVYTDVEDPKDLSYMTYFADTNTVRALNGVNGCKTHQCRR